METERNVDLEIYEMVYGANDVLIKENRKALKKIKFNPNLRALHNIGFQKTPEIVEAEKNNKIWEELEKKRELLEYYRVNYPFNKFIDDDSIIAICEKYNLAIVDVGLYIAEIPDKNKDEILNFRVKIKDLIHAGSYNDYDPAIGIILKERNEVLQPHIIDPRLYDIKVSSEDRTSIRSPQIVAPLHKIEHRPGDRLRHGRLVHDPIVLQPVKWLINKLGFLIVSSWGFESTIPEIRNEINN